MANQKVELKRKTKQNEEKVMKNWINLEKE